VRAAVLAAARAELLTKGFDDFAIGDVAKAAGVQKTSIYRRYKTREALILEVVVETADEGIAIPDTGTLAGDLALLLERTHAFLRSPVGEALAAIAHRRGSEELDLAQRSFWKQRFERLAVLFDRAEERGEIPAGIDRALVLSMALGPLWYRLFLSHEPFDKRVIRALVARILRSFA
jgi:AcrR family transcriptional regulator